jgi:hypothetical protein
MPENVALHVECGACRFHADIKVFMEDGELVYDIKSDCPYVSRMGQTLKRLPMMDCLKMPFCENEIYRIGGQELKHSACPVPMALIRGSEVAAGLGLKKEVKVEFKKD